MCLSQICMPVITSQFYLPCNHVMSYCKSESSRRTGNGDQRGWMRASNFFRNIRPLSQNQTPIAHTCKNRKNTSKPVTRYLWWWPKDIARRSETDRNKCTKEREKTTQTVQSRTVRRREPELSAVRVPDYPGLRAGLSGVQLLETEQQKIVLDRARARAADCPQLGPGLSAGQKSKTSPRKRVLIKVWTTAPNCPPLGARPRSCTLCGDRNSELEPDARTVRGSRSSSPENRQEQIFIRFMANQHQLLPNLGLV
jgi:hypothetical protein